MLRKGAYLAAGVPLGLVKGETLAAKIDHIYTEVGGKEFFDMASQGKDGSFMVSHERAGTILVIPAGFLLIILGTWAKINAKDSDVCATGIRWSHMKLTKKHVEEAKIALDSLWDEYPELRDAKGHYSQWRDTIANFLMPLTQSQESQGDAN